MTRTASARTTARRTLRPIAVGLVAVTAAIIGTLVYQSASSPAASPPRPGTAQPSAVTPRNGPLGTITWPASGVSAAGISGIGILPGPGASQPVPIASVAKVMTAYIILRDHPLGAGEPGPPIVVRPGEAAAYPAQVRNGDSLVPVTAGEQLTERQALEALLLPSADNMAWILARWDAGSQAAFTAQMNTTARRLGMTATHYTDPSGLSGSTTSTAADQVRLGMAAIREPALAQIVALRSAVIPAAGAWTRHSHRRRRVRPARHDGHHAAHRAAGRPPACAGTEPRPCWAKHKAHQRQSRKAPRGPAVTEPGNAPAPTATAT